MKHFIKQITLGAVLGVAMIAGGALATPAHAVTLNFDTLELPGTGGTIASNPYVESGYHITPGGGDPGVNFLFAWQQGSDHYAGSAGLLANVPGEVITLNEATNAAFSLVSIQLADALSPPLGGTSELVTFTAQLAGGGVTVQSFQPTLGLAFETFNFNSSFDNITSVSWVQGTFPNGHQFDNIVVGAPVPEPSTMLLFGSGLAGIVGWRYRKQNA